MDLRAMLNHDDDRYGADYEVSRYQDQCQQRARGHVSPQTPALARSDSYSSYSSYPGEPLSPMTPDMVYSEYQSPAVYETYTKSGYWGEVVEEERSAARPRSRRTESYASSDNGV